MKGYNKIHFHLLLNEFRVEEVKQDTCFRLSMSMLLLCQGSSR